LARGGGAQGQNSRREKEESHRRQFIRIC
jgi:hypothetical protein